MRKTTFPIDKREWCPSLIPGPLVLISTCTQTGVPNIAPKSWVQMVAFDPPVLMFSGTKGNPTEENILATGYFTINIVDSALAKVVFGCTKWRALERIEKSGVTITRSFAVPAPLIVECKAHLECKLYDTKEVGSGFVIFGEIVAASIDESILTSSPLERYKLLDQVVFLENQLFGHVSDLEFVD